MTTEFPGHSQSIAEEYGKSIAPRVSVIVITMNRREIVAACLKSLLKQTCRSMEIVVVDNGSSDGTPDTVRRFFPSVRFCRLSENAGVGGGRNHGAQMAAGEICIFIDDDAHFDETDAVEKAVAYFDRDSRLGCLAFRILQPEDRTEEYKSIPRRDKKVIREDYECSYFCGAGFACRRGLFLKLNMFWEPLFFIGEELDFSYRLLDRGYKILRASAVCVIHDETASARVPGKSIYYGVRSRFLVAVRNLPWIYVITHIFLWWTYLLLSAIRNGHMVYYFRGVRDALTDLPQAVRTRSRIARETLSRIRNLSGRIYY